MSQSPTTHHPLLLRTSLWFMVIILLLAAAFRFLAIDAAPPGWRDDELIEFNMDRRIADGWRPLFIAEAEGHEPVYHYLHAGTILLLGDNLIGYKWLPFAFGLLTVSLTYALAHKMFDRRVALLASALMAVSFWPIMYARFGVRHIGTLPWMLAAFYLLYPHRSTAEYTERTETNQGKLRVLHGLRGLLAGICLAAALMTYFAGRALPIIVIVFLIYLVLLQRSIFKRVWWRYGLAIATAVLIALPMFIEIARTPGAEKRTEVVGGPLIELSHGNVRPAIDTTLGTLGMFTFAGDPESLYNVSGRPVFDWISGVFFYLGVLLCFIRLKRIESGFVLAWLFVGIAPAFVSLPAGSFSHTLAAQPVIYMLAAFGIVAIVDKYASRQGNNRIVLSTCLLVSSAVIGLNAYLTIRDYFGTWAHNEFVRFQYHAPTRDIAEWLDQHPEISDVAIGTHPNELTLDPLALKLDLRRKDVRARWFNPDSAVVFPQDGIVLISAMQPMNVNPAPAGCILNRMNSNRTSGFEFYRFGCLDALPYPEAAFGGAIDLTDVWMTRDETAHPGEQITRTFRWRITHLAPDPNLKLFVHLLDDRNQVVLANDRYDVNVATLMVGDEFVQPIVFDLSADLKPGQYRAEIGWYNPDSGERLKLADGSDRFLLAPIEVTAR